MQHIPQTNSNRKTVPNPKSSCCLPAFIILSHLICSAHVQWAKAGTPCALLHTFSLGRGWGIRGCWLSWDMCSNEGHLLQTGKERNCVFCVVFGPLDGLKAKWQWEAHGMGSGTCTTYLGKIDCLRNHHSNSLQSACKQLIWGCQQDLQVAQGF